MVDFQKISNEITLAADLGLINATLLSVIESALKVNTLTNHCVFVNISAHVSRVDLKICQSKFNYNDVRDEFSFYYGASFDKASDLSASEVIEKLFDFKSNIESLLDQVSVKDATL